MTGISKIGANYAFILCLPVFCKKAFDKSPAYGRGIKKAILKYTLLRKNAISYIIKKECYPFGQHSFNIYTN